MEADRLRPRRLPEDVVLEDPHAAVAGELRSEATGALGEHLRRDDGVGLPRVAELPRAVLGVAPRHPVHLVRPDAGLVLAVEEPEVALAQELESASRRRVPPRRSGTRRVRNASTCSAESDSIRSAAASCRGRRTGSGRPSPGCASGGRRACRPRAPCRAPRTARRPARARCSSCRIGLRVPLVTTPTRWRPDVDLVAVPGGLVALELEADEHAAADARALLERRAADEVVVRLQIDREADPRLERVDLVVELVAGEDQPRLDAEDVERLEAERRQAVLARRPPRSRPRRPARRTGGTTPRSRARPCSPCARRRSGSRRTSRSARP